MALSLSITSDRTSGCAPLGVHFDASATTGPDNPAVDVEFIWEFDDDEATYPTDGKSKDEERGIVVAHTFETPGTRTVRCTARTATEEATDTIEVTITDPDTVYAGTDTLCFSTSGDFTGKPTGATEVTLGAKAITSADATTDRLTVTGHGYSTGWIVHAADAGGTLPVGVDDETGYFVRVIDANTVSLHTTLNGANTNSSRVDVTDTGTGELRTNWHTAILTRGGSNKRLLFCGGETFGAYMTTDKADFGYDGVRIGTYGTGKATVQSSFAEALPFRMNGVTDLAVENIIFDANGKGGLGFGATGTIAQQITLLRCETTGNWSRGFQFSSSADTQIKSIVIQDCVMTGGVYNIFAMGEYVSILGCDLDYTVAGTSEHNVRLPCIDKGQFAHNELLDGSDTKHIFRLSGSANTQPDNFTQYVTVSDNEFVCNRVGVAWVIHFGPPDNSNYSDIRYCVFERNFIDIQTAASGPIGVVTYCRDSVFRNNLLRHANTSSPRFFSTDGHYGNGDSPAPANLRFDNNSAYSAATSGTTIMVDLDRDVSAFGTVDEIAVYNNVLCVPHGTPTKTMVDNPDGATNVDEVTNRVSATPGFTVPPTTAADFSLAADSVCLDAGTVTVSIYDYSRNFRGSAFDQGAVERNTEEYGVDPVSPPGLSSEGRGRPARRTKRMFVDLQDKLVEVSGYKEAERLLGQLKTEEKLQEKERKRLKILLGRVQDTQTGLLYETTQKQIQSLEKKMDKRDERIEKLSELILKKLEETNEDDEEVLLLS